MDRGNAGSGGYQGSPGARIGTLDERTRAQVVDAIDRLAEAGPALGRPLVDSIAHSCPQPQGTAARLYRAQRGAVLFAFGLWRSAILFNGGDKSGDWRDRYRRAIPHPEELYAKYLKEREAEEGR